MVLGASKSSSPFAIGGAAGQERTAAGQRNGRGPRGEVDERHEPDVGVAARPLGERVALAGVPDAGADAVQCGDLEASALGLGRPQVDEALSQRRVVEQIGTVEPQLDRADLDRRQLAVGNDGVTLQVTVEHYGDT